VSMGRKISIRMSEGDVEELERLQKKLGWSKSRAVRFLLQKFGRILIQGEISDLETVEESVGVPDKCPSCGGTLSTRAPLKLLSENVYDEIRECDGCRGLFRVVWQPIVFRSLEERK